MSLPTFTLCRTLFTVLYCFIEGIKAQKVSSLFISLRQTPDSNIELKHPSGETYYRNLDFIFFTVGLCHVNLVRVTISED